MEIKTFFFQQRTTGQNIRFFRNTVRRIWYMFTNKKKCFQLNTRSIFPGKLLRISKNCSNKVLPGRKSASSKVGP